METSKKEKILFVSYNHGSNNVADSVQNHRLIPALERFYEIDVISRKKKGNSEGIWSPNLYIFDRLIYKFFPFLISAYCLDVFVWCVFAFFYIRRFLSKYDYIIFVYEPYTSRFLHYFIKKSIDRKIISLLYDPYFDNLFLNQTKAGKTLRKRIEQKVVNLSDLIVVNSHMLLDKLKERYPSNIISYIPFCANPSYRLNYKRNSIEKDKITILHAGNIHGKRNLDLLNQIVSVLKQKRSVNIANKVQIIMLGGCPELEKEKVNRAGNGDIIKFYGFVNQDVLKEYQVICDALLLINPVGEENYSYPSKLCEYFQLNKVIFTIGSLESAANEDLIKAGHVVCDGNNIGEFADAILEFVSNTNYYYSRIDKEFFRKFEPDKVALSYHLLFNTL